MAVSVTVTVEATAAAVSVTTAAALGKRLRRWHAKEMAWPENWHKSQFWAPAYKGTIFGLFG